MPAAATASCWLATFPDLVEERGATDQNENGRAPHRPTFDINRLAVTKNIEKYIELDGCNGRWRQQDYRVGSGCIVGYIKFEVVDCYSHLTLLSDHEREQYHFWHSVLNQSLEGCLYICRVIGKPGMLPRPEPVQRTSMRRGRGLLCSVQQGQYDDLVGILKDGQPGHHIELQCARVALRLPLPYAYLVAVGRWASFLIPSVEARMSWIANWKQLHVRLPSPVAMMFSGASAAGLTADVVQPTADYLRGHCHRQDLVNVDSEAAMEVHKLLSTLQEYVDEMQPAGLKALTTSGLMSTNPELLFEAYGGEAMPMLSSGRTTLCVLRGRWRFQGGFPPWGFFPRSNSHWF